MKRIPLAAVLSLLSLQAAFADDCLDKAATQADMNACAQKAYAASDAALNTLYRQIEHRLRDDAVTRKHLVSAQRAWLAFRDAECQFEVSGAEGGSASLMAAATCLAKLTRQRVDDFENLLKCREGDLSCPVPPAE